MSIDTSTAPELTDSAPPGEWHRRERLLSRRNLGAGALAALPGLLTLYLSFNAGGFYPGGQAVALVVLAGVVVLRMAFVRDAFAGFSKPLLVAVGAMTAYALFALVSSGWSHSPVRALLEFELASVYLFTLLLFGSSTRSHRRLRWTMILTWLAMTFVCIAALATRLRPDLFPIPANLSPNRLAYPLTYWNALGLFAVIGIVLSCHLASSTREPRTMRIFATAVIPVFAVTILLTYSRAALALGIVGLLAYVLIARPRGALSTLLAAAPTSAFAIANTYQANLISNGITSAAATQQGRHLSTMVLAACLAAGLIRVAMLELDVRFAEFKMSRKARRNARSQLALLCVAAVFIVIFGFGGQISRQWSEFTKSDAPVGSDIRSRISVEDFRIGGRLPGWRIAIKDFDQNPLHGRGAGTFPIAWFQSRPDGAVAIEAHSLYLQAMSDLGVVGLITVVVAVLLPIGACFLRSRRGARSLWTALGVVGVVWALHAGVDWDWEMPAVTLPVLALTAAALSRRGGKTRIPWRAEVAARLLVGVASVAIVILALRIGTSDRHLDSSVADFNGGNCPAAVANARATISAISARPQPYQIIALCDVVTGHPASAVSYIDEAVTRDPQSWIYRYSQAVVTAANGHDPQPVLKQAQLLDPLEPIIAQAQQTFRGGNPRRWERQAPHVELIVTTTDD